MAKTPPKSKTASAEAKLRRQITTAYAAHLREHGAPPASLAAFCKTAKVTERQFFGQFPNLEAVESAFWADVLDDLLAAVAAGRDYKAFGARQRMLVLGYAWLEKAPDLRILLLHRFGKLPPFMNPAFLKGFAARFKEHARALVALGQEKGEIASRGRLDRLYPDALYLAFRTAIEFNLRDESPGYERSDAYMEKVFTLAFDLMGNQAIDSAVDLAKFLIPRSLAAH